MGRYHQERTKTGREYVDATRKFAAITLERCMRLPDKWNEYLLRPLILKTQEIEGLVIRANAIYINEKNQNADIAIEAYEQRIHMLQQALRVFKDYDTSFEHLMNYVDIAGAEKRRLKNLLLEIIKEEKEKNPETKEIEIHVISRPKDMEYQSTGAVKTFTLKLTAKNKDHWIDVEADARTLVAERIENDKKAINRLKKNLESDMGRRL